jgi:transforming growth factor-beta-induced protein
MKFESLFGVFGIVAALSFVGCNSSYEGKNGQFDGEVATTDDSSSTELTASDVEQDAQESKDIIDTAVAAGDFGTLAAALTAGELIETLKSDGPFTVFAPTDEAFAKLPEGTVENLLKPENKDQLVAILTYHVVPGKVDAAAVSSLKTAQTVNGAEITIDASSDGVKINNASVTTADVVCSNGIIHVIDTVILPPAEESAQPSHDGEPLMIEGVGSFKTLFAAIEAAGLNETLAKDGPFTVFAPTDEAFAALPEGTVENLLKPENKEQLVAILTYHVVSGKVPSSEVVELTSAKTVNGAEVTIKVTEGTVQVDDATVLKTDVPCEVGLIHAIDKVLMP